MYWRQGKEVIQIDDKKMVIKSEGDYMNGAKAFEIAEVKNFNVDHQAVYGYFKGINYNPFGKSNKKGTIKFDYGMKTYRFGIWMEEAEGRYLIELLKSKNLIS